MKKEIIGNATLYLGDCLEILPTLDRVDAVITDPPYGTSFVGGYNRKGETIQNDDDLSVVSAALFDLRMRGVEDYLIFYSPRVSVEFHEATNFLDWAGQIIWDKKAPGMGGGLRYQHECVGVFGDIKKINNAFSVLTFYRKAEVHPHQKPIEVMDWLIGKYTPQTILDPFMGSGTTGVACMNLGRKFIGIEIEPKYFEIACERIEQAQKQCRLFE